jgi:hypothetical protein
MPDTPDKSVAKSPSEERASMAALRKASDDLKSKIAEAKARNDIPLDSALGNPKWEKDAADGHLDVPDEDDQSGDG